MPKYIVTHRYTLGYFVEAKDADEAREIANGIPFKWEDAERCANDDVELLKGNEAEGFAEAGWRLYGKDDVDLQFEEGMPV